MKPRAEELLSFFPFLCVGSLQIRYNLGGTREPYNIDVEHRNMANGQPHSVNITRHEKTIILKVSICYLSIVHDIVMQSLSSVILGHWFGLAWLGLAWFGVIKTGGKEVGATLSHKFLTREVQRYVVSTGKTMMKLMGKRFLGRR